MLVQLLHNSVVASEQLAMHSHTNSGEPPHSLKPLAEPIQASPAASCIACC
jgi:hypothetical protein